MSLEGKSCAGYRCQPRVIGQGHRPRLAGKGALSFGTVPATAALRHSRQKLIGKRSYTEPASA